MVNGRFSGVFTLRGPLSVNTLILSVFTLEHIRTSEN